jgi:hypothetical protein
MCWHKFSSIRIVFIIRLNKYYRSCTMKKNLNVLVFFFFLLNVVSFGTYNLQKLTYTGYVSKVELDDGSNQYCLDRTDILDDDETDNFETYVLIEMNKQGQKLVKLIDKHVKVVGSLAKNKDSINVLRVTSFIEIDEEDVD